MVALQTILNPQEEVIFPSPYWVSYPEMVKLCGANPVPVLPEDGTFYPRIKDIEQRVGPFTKAEDSITSKTELFTESLIASY